jgi:hypothetical protein
LERYKDLCDDAWQSNNDKVKRLPRYCTFTYGQYVKELTSWQEAVWEKLKDNIAYEFKAKDSFQLMNSVPYLIALKSKQQAEHEDVRLYTTHLVHHLRRLGSY